MNKLSIKNKLTLSILFIIIVFGVFATIATFFISQRNFLAIKKESVLAETVEQSHETAQIFKNSRQLISAISRQHVLVEYIEHDPKVQDAAILEVFNHYNIGNVYDPIYLMDLSGEVIVSTDPQFVGNNYGFRDYFKRALRGDASIESAIGATTGRPGYFFAYPVLLSDGTVGGVLAGKIPSGSIDASLQASTLADSGRIMFVDADGIVLYSNDPSRLYKSISRISPERKKEISDSKRFGGLLITELQYDAVMDRIRSYDKPFVIEFYDVVDKEDELAVVAHVVDAPFFIIVELDADFLATPLISISLALSIAVLFSAFFAAIFSYPFFARFLRPLELLKKAAMQISKGDRDYTLAIKTGDEFEDLANAFNEMSHQLSVSYAQLEDTIAQKTTALSEQLQEVENKNIALRNTQRAVLNVLEDARALELQLQDERDQFKGIVSSMGEGLFVLNKDLRIVLINPQAERILGVGRDALQGVFLPDIIRFYKGKEMIPEKDRPLHRVISENITLAADIKDDFYWEVEGGKRFPLGLVAAPISIGGLVGAVIVFRDLTKEKSLDDARTSFISITSHQLRTPLTSLKWFLEMLMDGSYAQPLTPEQKNFANLAYQSADRMMGIINLLLQIARVEAGRVKVVPVPTDLSQFIHTIIDSFGNAFALKRQRVVVSTTPDPLPKIAVDTDILGQVFQNLVSNANRYALEDTVISVACIVEGDHILCSVTDKGIGISKNDASRIFEKFYRAENALRMVPEGSGLGLSLVKSLVEGWGGKIWFASEEWTGTTFFFTIPASGMASREGEVGIRVS